MLDGLPHEMGAVVMTPSYVNTLPILKQLGLDTTLFPYSYHFDVETKLATQIRPTRALLRQVWAFRTFLKRHSAAFATPGRWQLDPAICQPFAGWAQAMGFGLVSDLLVPFVTCYGYGHVDDIPAAYILKYLHVRNFDAMLLSLLWRRLLPRALGLNTPWVKMTRLGNQRIPERLVSGLDVRIGSRISAIEAPDGPGNGYTLAIAGTPLSERFDAIVFATIPAGIAGLEAILPEALPAIVARIRHRSYTTILCRLEGVPVGCYYLDLAAGRVFSPGPEQLACVVRMHHGSNGCVLYHLANEPVSEAALEAAIEASLDTIGATMIEIVETRRWQYFPHFETAFLSDDPFTAFEAAQGQNGLYYTGAYLDFESIENSLGSTLRIVDHHFP
jgi:hypothetical protein